MQKHTDTQQRRTNKCRKSVEHCSHMQCPLKLTEIDNNCLNYFFVHLVWLPQASVRPERMIIKVKICFFFNRLLTNFRPFFFDRKSVKYCSQHRIWLTLNGRPTITLIFYICCQNWYFTSGSLFSIRKYFSDLFFLQFRWWTIFNLCYWLRPDRLFFIGSSSRASRSQFDNETTSERKSERGEQRWRGAEQHQSRPTF